jgi:hypothetical protein
LKDICAGDTYESITAEMDDVFASFAGLSRASKEIWNKIYPNALQIFEIIDISKVGKIA